MQIAVDAFGLRRDHHGIGRYVRSILHFLRRQEEIDTTLVVETPEDGFALLDSGLRVRTLASARREPPFDLVWHPWNAINFRLGRAARVSTVYDMSPYTQPQAQLLRRMRVRHALKAALHESHVVCTPSSSTRELIAKRLGRRQTPVLLVPPAPMPFWRRGVVVTAPDKPYILLIAGSHGRKNLAFAVQAMEAAFPDQGMQFVVVGDLNDEDFALLDASQCDYQRERPDDAELRELYRRARMLIVPSRSEGFGLSMLEAMACGTPVLAAHASALPEIADGAAILLPPDDVGAWTRAIRDLAYDEGKRRQLATLGLERIKRIPADQAGQKTLEAFYYALKLRNIKLVRS